MRFMDGLPEGVRVVPGCTLFRGGEPLSKPQHAAVWARTYRREFGEWPTERQVVAGMAMGAEEGGYGMYISVRGAWAGLRMAREKSRSV
jgi:hypothetical protein